MRTKSTYLLLIIILFAILSCHRNRLKTNEEALAKEILLQEKNEAEKLASKKQFSDTLNRLPNGFRFKEDRYVDPRNPPVKIDIAGSLNNIKEIKLSDVAATISYLRIEPVPDSIIPVDLKFKYYMMDNYIVALNLYGIHLYSKEGRYLRSVVKNELTGVIVEPGRLIFWNDYTLKGGGMTAWGSENNLYYTYSNTMTGEKYIMKYDCSTIQMIPDYRFDPENPDQISGLGNVAVDLNHGKTEPPKPRKHQGMFSGSPEGFFKDMGVFMLDPNSYAVPTHDENMMVILNNQGDTLSEFIRLEKLINYTKTMMRGTDNGTQYEDNGVLYLRPAFNDTVFRVIPPGRLYPVYVLKLGEYKVTKQEGVDPDFKLTGKIIPEEWAETKSFIFLTFTKDDYDCPNTRENKTVKIYHALYSKQNKLFSVIKGDPFNYFPEILENNIDGGVPVWPLSYMISKNGEIMIPLKGSDLKERVKSKEFKLSGAPEAKKNELERLAGSVTESEDILMIIK
ncbi:MAG: DUF4933 domain-containing protein [Bacteroidales bacterium]|nr:DUF4933 domain-containing protein [Bacteroidales bacterium]